MQNKKPFIIPIAAGVLLLVIAGYCVHWCKASPGAMRLAGIILQELP